MFPSLIINCGISFIEKRSQVDIIYLSHSYQFKKSIVNLIVLFRFGLDNLCGVFRKPKVSSFLFI